jgi:alpha-tubulin suppressor-like RCC1 family protein
MSQGIFNNINPETTTGLMLASLLDDFKVAICSGFSGISRPANLQGGGIWVDTSQQEAPNYIWSMKLFTGTVDIEIFRISILSGASGAGIANSLFTVRKISADTAGAILNLVKNRVLNSGQVLSGDTIAELRLTGRTNSSTDPVVAYIRATATDSETTVIRGVTLSLVSAPVATGTLVEHMRLLTNLVETVLAHKINSKIFGSDSVATATDILATSDSILSEFTGSTATNINGIEVGTAETRLKIIHNRSTAELLIKHDSGLALAAQRFTLPAAEDLVIRPQGSVAFYYCETDTRWKFLFGKSSGAQQFIYNFPEGYTEWVAPLSGYIRVVSSQDTSQEPTAPGMGSAICRSGVKSYQAWGLNDFDQLGSFSGDQLAPAPGVGNPALKLVDIGRETGVAFNAVNEQFWCWGFNRHGQLLNTFVGGTQPTASSAISDVSFTRVEMDESAWGQTFHGALYAWGLNTHGQLGVGDVIPRSSPIAVLGGFKFASFFHGAEGTASVYGVERDTGALYAWGRNQNGQLGIGNVSSQSSPIAVLGGFKFRKVAVGSGSVVGLSESGVAYAWGGNSDGELGVGNITPRSSPVAVLGGHTFVDVAVIPGTDNSFFGITEDGTLYAWGSNAHGELGLGDVASRSSPVAVVGGLKWERLARLSSDTRSIVALQLGTGVPYAWGRNNFGQLGVNDVIPRSSPVAVVGGLKFSYVTVGSGFMYGQASDGRYYGWGLNTTGSVGDGTGTDRSSPVAVVGYTEPFFEIPVQKVIKVVKGTTYKLRVGGGASFFSSTFIGKNIRRVSIAYEK